MAGSHESARDSARDPGREPTRGDLAAVGVAVAFPLGRRCWAGTWHARSVAVRWSPHPVGDATALAQLRHPGLAPVLAVRPLDAGGSVVISRLVPGRRWTQAVPAGSLPGRDLARLAAPVASGLAAAHARGLVVDPLEADNLVVTDEGALVATGLRTVSQGGSCPGSSAAPEGDVAALCAILALAWDGRAGDGDLRLALSGAPRDAAGLAALLARAGGADPPVRVPARRARAARPVGPGPGVTTAAGPTRVARHRGRGRLRSASRHRGGRVLVAGCAALLVGVIGSGVLLHRVGAPAAAAATGRPSVSRSVGRVQAGDGDDWTAAVEAVEAARSRVFAAPNRPGALAAADLPGSSAYRIDAATRDRLRAAGLRADGVSVRVARVRVVRRRGGAAVLEVVDSTTPYLVRDAAGGVLDRQPAGPLRAWVLVLVRSGHRWLLASASPAAWRSG